MSFNPGGSGGGLAGASDVALSLPNTSQVLTYDSTTAKWKNQQAPVTSVNSKVGGVILTKADIGLGTVDNTPDLNKPISTPTQTALNHKVTTNSPNMQLDYGTSLPPAGTPGRFFIVIPS